MSAQNFTPTALREDNQIIRSLAEKVDTAGWLFMKDDVQLPPSELFTTLKPNMGLSIHDTMVLVKSEVDEFDIQHNRYQQYHKGLRVEAAEYSEHIVKCQVKIAHGKILENVKDTIEAILSERDALTIALNKIGAQAYSWQDTVWASINDYEEDSLLCNTYPAGELLLAKIGADKVVAENYRTCWRFEIMATDPVGSYEVYVDARSGEIHKVQLMECHNGPAVLLYDYGTRIIDTRFHNELFNDYHFLRAQDETRNIHTREGTFDLLDRRWGRYAEVRDDNDNWGVAAAANTTAHWVVSQSWDYFRSVHGRRGWDGNGGLIRVIANSNLLNNARFIWGQGLGLGWLEFGAFLGNEMATIDIGGHEFTHGFIRQVSGLGGAGESGALNESFSDIFGFLIERFSFPNDFNWLQGEDALAGTGFERSLANPGDIVLPQVLADRPALGLPNVFEGQRWYDGDGDAGGVHINCGPQNRWFNLLSVGGVEAETGIAVQGIGIDQAARIVFFSLSHFIQNNSLYADARNGAIAAARILFGPCSFEVIQTTNAWAAVGVGEMFNGPCLEVNGPALVCVQQEGLPQSWEATSLTGSNITWNVPSTWNVSTSGPNDNILTLNSVSPIPAASVTSATISAISSTGGSIDFEVTIINNCHFFAPPCEEKSGYRMPQNKADSENSLKIYPNPAKDVVVVHVPNEDSPMQFQLLDISGRTLPFGQVPGQQFDLDISRFPAGVYYFRIHSQNAANVVPIVKK